MGLKVHMYISHKTNQNKIHPEEVLIAEYDGKSYVLASLQDPSAVVVYDITDPTNPTWDSGEIVQLIDYSTGEGESILFYLSQQRGFDSPPFE